MVLSVFTVACAFAAVALAVPTRRSPPSGQIATNTDPSLCVAPAGDANANGTPVELVPCTSTSASWTWSTGSLRIFNGKCLDARDGVQASGTRLQIWDCTGRSNQQFQLNPPSILWVGTGLCVDVTDGDFSAQTPLQVWKCTDGPNQHFTFPAQPPANPHTLFKPVSAPNLCMDVASGADADGTALQIYSCNGTPAQSFYAADGGIHVFQNKAIDLTNGDKTNGNKLQIWTSSSGNTNQQWFYDETNQAIKLKADSSKCIDITDGNFHDGTRLQVWDCTGGPNQRFSRVQL